MIYKKENIMAKEIIFSDNARNRLFAGVEKLRKIQRWRDWVIRASFYANLVVLIILIFI